MTSMEFRTSNLNNFGFNGVPDGYVRKDELDKLVDQKLLRRQKHPKKDLYLYKYTEFTTFTRSWNPITLMCRGIVINGKGKIISHPFHKFFNYGEMPHVIPVGMSHEVFEKMDGSLIVVSIDEDGDLLVTSSGSFESDHVKWAYQLFNELDARKFIMEGATYVFELIHPDNQIVVNYGEEKKLVLLGVRSTETGNDVSWSALWGIRHGEQKFPFEIVKRYDGLSIDNVLAERHRKDFINREGYIVRFENGYRLKIKFDEYCRLRKIRTEFTEKHVWEAMRDGVDLPLENLPDEMYEWIKQTQRDLQRAYDATVDEADGLRILALKNMPKDFNNLPHNWKKKHFANEVKKGKYDEYRSILFAMIDGKSYKYMIWDKIKPIKEEINA